MKMKAAVVRQATDPYKFEEIELAEPKNDEVLVRITDGQSKLSQNGQPVAMFFGQSSFAQYATISEKSIVKIDEDVDLAMIAPFGCGVQTGAGAVW